MLLRERELYWGLAHADNKRVQRPEEVCRRFEIAVLAGNVTHFDSGKVIRLTLKPRWIILVGINLCQLAFGELNC